MKRIFLILLVAIFLSKPVFAAPKVVVSILPLHDLVSQLGAGVFEPKLLLNPNVSPHDAALKPSQIRDLAASDVVFWIDPDLESNLAKVISNLKPDDTQIVRLMAVEGLSLLPFRDSLVDYHNEHSHGSHNHDDANDPHIWLSYDNMRIAVLHMAEVLIQLDPENKAIYQTNREALLAKMRNLNETLEKRLKPVQPKGFILLHDSQNYFDAQYQLNMVSVLVQHALHELGAKGIQQAQDLASTHSVQCLFAQPQFASESALKNLADTLNVKYKLIDPIGATLDDYEDAWFKTMTSLAETMYDCLQ